ncbi:uncharacterized protein LOC141901006 [Tubulanus polymorphus]|uniref:uncharacterized protein LOC141901006 n=1 Tax=Tubulanus polymorphus TaxID=672921 RepID=UPI003DA489C3
MQWNSGAYMRVKDNAFEVRLNLDLAFTLVSGLQDGFWNFVGMAYDNDDGVLKYWVNENVGTQNIGKIISLTTGDIYFGVQPPNNNYFTGYLGCIQAYDISLPDSIIFKAKLLCQSVSKSFY